MTKKFITNSVNDSLSYLLNQVNKNAKYCIVDSNGNGHFSKLSEAINASAKYIFIRNGDYSESSNITITNQNIIGESKDGVNITLNNCYIKCKDTTEEVSQNAAGFAVDITNASVDVEDSFGATLGFTIVDEDETTKIQLRTLIAKVASIENTSLLKLSAPFQGKTSSVIPWILFNEETASVIISNLTIITEYTSSIQKALHIQGKNVKLLNIGFESTNDFSSFIYTGGATSNQPTFNAKIIACTFEGGYNSIDLQHAHCSVIEYCHFQTSKNYDIYATETATFNKFRFNTSSGSKRGFSLIGEGNIAIGNTFEMNDEYAIKVGLTKGATQINSVQNNKFINCGNGTNPVIYSITKRTTISGNNFEGCEKCIFIDSNTYDQVAVLISKNFFNSCKEEIKILSENNSIIANVFKDSDSGTSCINATNGDSVIANNVFVDCDIPFSNASYITLNSNQFIFAIQTTITISSDSITLNNNIFEKCTISISGANTGIRNNTFRDTTSLFPLVIISDDNMIVNNIFTNSVNGIDVQATADKSHLIENIFDSITTTTIQDNGTNTVQANNIS